MTKSIKNHPNFNLQDYQYLNAKGYSDREILAKWTSERKDGKTACQWNTYGAQAKLASTLRTAR